MQIRDIADLDLKLEAVKGWTQGICDAYKIDYYLTWVVRHREPVMAEARKTVVLQARQAGWSIRVIAALLGYSDSMVMKIMRDDKKIEEKG